jgi:uncharacterized protein YjbI with pentapeptide repeats
VERDIPYYNENTTQEVNMMANQEHLNQLRQGIDGWNRWRAQHPNIVPDLVDANISEADLTFADLSHANLSYVNFRHSNLSHANLSGTDLSHTYLSYADLSHAILNSAILNHAVLRHANLSHADLSHANLGYAYVESTTFGDLDLRTVIGLETVKHEGPSTIGIDTIVNSEGYIPEVFLRGAGVSDTFITYIRSLVGKSIEYYSCFISYSSKDQEFVERLYADLQSKGVRCWFAPEDLKTGDKIRDRIDQSIRVHDKLLLVLSQHSVNSAWVEFEVEAAIAKENSRNALMLFPIRLDSAVKESPTSWAAHIRRTRHITDFSNWKQHDDYQKGLNRLLRDLQPDNPPQHLAP